MKFKHISVLLDECIDGLRISPDGIYVDGTCGGGGHSLEIAKKLSKGRLISIDKDPDALQFAHEKLKGYNATLVENDFCNLSEVLVTMNIKNVDGILLDLGVSSYQLDNGERGFSYNCDAPLDMRMSKSGTSAADIVNSYERSDLERIIRIYSEEKFAHKIAFEICRAREKSPIKTTFELNDIIKRSIPSKMARNDTKNPCRRTYQALRIETNDELEALKIAIESGFEKLTSGGRFCIITFHSLEDRIVKQAFVKFASGCDCPPEFPVCICGKTPRGKIITKKPITATETELEQNSRSRSAKLRIIEKL